MVKGWGGFVRGSKFKSQWGQKFTYQIYIYIYITSKEQFKKELLNQRFWIITLKRFTQENELKKEKERKKIMLIKVI